jgi:hypothetical protein
MGDGFLAFSFFDSFYEMAMHCHRAFFVVFFSVFQGHRRSHYSSCVSWEHPRCVLACFVGVTWNDWALASLQLETPRRHGSIAAFR